jgi:hypothetical protein
VWTPHISINGYWVLGLFFRAIREYAERKDYRYGQRCKKVFLGIKTIAVANARAGAKLLLCLEG